MSLKLKEISAACGNGIQGFVVGFIIRVRLKGFAATRFHPLRCVTLYEEKRFYTLVIEDKASDSFKRLTKCNVYFHRDISSESNLILVSGWCIRSGVGDDYVIDLITPTFLA